MTRIAIDYYFERLQKLRFFVCQGASEFHVPGTELGIVQISLAELLVGGLKVTTKLWLDNQKIDSKICITAYTR